MTFGIGFLYTLNRMSAQSKELNLLPSGKWETGIPGKLLRWALKTGRYIVVFTELIVISAFLYRFGLDRKLTDLNEEMKLQLSAVNTYGDLETNFRNLQSRLELIKQGQESSLKPDLILTNISQITPIDTAYSTISIDKETVSLQGQTLSEIGLATLLAKAQANEVFSEVNLESVSSPTEKSQAIDFTLSLTLKNVPK